MTASVSFRNVSFAWPGNDDPVVEHLSFDVVPGEFVLLSGHSGSGKSTVLRMLNGLVPHSSGGRFGGQVIANGRNTRHSAPRDLATSVGMVFQDPEAQMITSRVDDEIAFALEQRGVAPRVIRQRLEDVLDLLGIEHLRHRVPGTLSGGEQQRVAIAAAMALQPPILALDEPTSQLDPAAADGVLDLLTRLHDDLGITVITAEHRMERLLHRVDRVFDLHASPMVHDIGDPHGAAEKLPGEILPPVSQLGRAFGVTPIPLTVNEARRSGLVSAFRLRFPQRVASPDPRLAGTPLVGLRDASIAHDGRRALDRANLTLHRCEIVALMGRNGSGKSTLLRSIARFQPLSEGAVDPARPDAFAWLPQQASTVFFRESLREEIAWTLSRRRSTVRIETVLDEFGLERAALATMLAGDPLLILLDEPTRGMDARRKGDLIDALRRRRDGGAGILIATHDADLVGRLADRVIVLSHGEIIAEGHPEDVLPGSLSLAPQITRLLGAPWLTIDDVPLTLPEGKAGE
jgi:energy-coupling factor transport system ATP-binding protein